MTRTSCSSCARFGGCQSPLTCQVPGCESDQKPALPWGALVCIAIAIVAIFAAFIRSFS